MTCALQPAAWIAAAVRSSLELTVSPERRSECGTTRSHGVAGLPLALAAHTSSTRLGATLAKGAQPLKKAVVRFDKIHVAGHGLDDDAGNILASRIEQCTNRVQVVISCGQRMLGDVCRNAR